MLGCRLFGTSEFMFSYNRGLAVPTLEVRLCLLLGNLLDSKTLTGKLADIMNIYKTLTDNYLNFSLKLEVIAVFSGTLKNGIKKKKHVKRARNGGYQAVSFQN